MGEQVTDFDWSTAKGRKSRYPWDQWFNGETWKLVQGEDFKVDCKSFRDQAYGRSYYKRHKVRVSIDEPYVYLQAINLPDDGDTT